MDKTRVLTTGEAAKYCGVNFRTVIRWIERGRLEAYKLPGRGDHRIRLEDFIHFLKSNDMPVPEELCPEVSSSKVLVVEDQLEMASAMRRVLRRAGYEVEVAADGFAAGLMLAQCQPAVMTLDIKMPGMDGYEVLKTMREQAVYKNVKVLVVSAETPAGMQKALEFGANDVLSKPFDNDELLDKVATLMGTVSEARTATA
ncbi:response regulator [Pseudoteredinibacter isoporae]|uniref:Excisionase family DNA binding protein n=1 Tax=Pseudoteredinibacter isoporae TaxID=570281 RepID=A0A7X0MXP2_9GAMM|nr:response regulator [Pseudoteredinibacter isoporae]MBB6521162.1 excisionase family DNA binding protein [Pseudoteredinibacter isoporae]NHO86722.1 response regulator [Pseudoteredinibacter isoporae]NIB24826.1 response regulator [Pseudoteredinibacter isoporae]